MVKLVSLDCPACGARLSVPGDAASSRCEYCHSEFRVAEQARRAPAGPPIAGVPPVAPPRRGAAGVWIAVLIPLLLAGGGGAYFLYVQQQARLAAAPPQAARPAAAAGPVEAHAARPKPMVAGNRQPMLHDVDGDGTLDAIVWTEYPLDDLRTHIAAYEPASGAQLWESAAIGDSSDERWRIESYLVGDRILLADLGGGLRALSAKTGAELWRAPMSERVESVCGAEEEGVVHVVLTDERVVELTLATGSFAPADRTIGRYDCDYVWSATNGERPDTPIDEWRRSRLYEPAIDGMRVDHSLHDYRSGRAYALGTRTPGTAVPMVAAYDRDARERKRRRRSVTVTPHWVRAVPGGDPLKVREADPVTADLAAGRLFVPYEMASDEEGWRMAAIDVETGETLWDEPVATADHDVQTMAASETHVFVTHWKAMDVLDAATGELLHRIDNDR